MMSKVLVETAEESKNELFDVARDIWSKIQNREINKESAISEIEDLEIRIKVLKKLEGELTANEKKAYVPVELAIKELKKVYKQMK